RKGYETVFFPYINSGVPDSAFLVFTGQEAWVASHTEALKRFFACLREGLKLVKSWQDEQWRSYTATLEGRNGDEERAVWKTILPMIDDGGGLFQHNLEEIRKLQDILCANGLLDTPYPVEEIFVNTHV
ncbi:MAG: hypothetical protein IT318_09760, partial [Anaerolineales bacterium]|nr:hypothetical protein [Anaerolineales bacterium]